MAAYLYYRRASPVLSDGDYDRLAAGIVKRWDKLDPHLQWQLGSKIEIMTSGHHIKITKASEAAACLWHLEVKGHIPFGGMIADWAWDDDHQVNWVSAEG